MDGHFFDRLIDGRLRHALRRALLLGGLSLLLGGCISRVVTPYVGDTAKSAAALPAVGDGIFAYQPRIIQATATEVDKPRFRRYAEQLLNFPPVDPTAQVSHALKARYYASRQAGPRKLVIVLPIWGSYRYPPDKVTKTLLKRSRGRINVLHVDGEQPIYDWTALRDAPSEAQFVSLAEQMTERWRLNIIGIRQLVDWARRRPEIDPEAIGLVGFSVSAIAGATVIGLEPRLAGAVLVMGSVHPGEVFATCNGQPGEARNGALLRFGWSLYEYQALFERLFTAGDPVDFVGRFSAQRLLIMESANDDCMTRQARDTLWETAGRPQRISFGSGHKGAFLALTPLNLNYGARKIYQFLDEVM